SIIYLSDLLNSLSFIFFQCTIHFLDLLSFPTRRSSDLPLLWPFSESVCPASNLYMYGGDHEFLLHHARRPMPCARIYAQWPLQSDRKSTRLNSSHVKISYAVFCLKKKKKNNKQYTTT